MRAIHARRRLAVFLGIGAALALIAAGAAYALTASSFKYSTPKTGYKRIHNMAFAPFDASQVYSNTWNQGLSATASQCLSAGVELPVGSRVKAITFYFKSGTGGDFFGDLWRMRLSNAKATRLANAFPSNDANTPTSVTVNIPSTKQAVTADHAYGVGVCPGAGDIFYGAKIKYTYTSAGS